MLKWLGGADAAEHPMANLAYVKETLATIPAEDSMRAAQDAEQWLESIETESHF